MKIGELAGVTGTNAKTIRFYEAEGLMPEPVRLASGYRSYDDESVSRMEFILKAKRLGLSLHEIMGILRLHDAEESTCVHVRDLLEQKIAEIESTIDALNAFKGDLASLRDRAIGLVDCKPLGSSICSIIEQSNFKGQQPVPIAIILP
ncbi:MAG: heavy metal-responsive transcriptional regulator [Chloroflexi bacterium]|nr:heavy metal-responsive transcriptional regulator [Chloroflexota bacterium]